MGKTKRKLTLFLSLLILLTLAVAAYRLLRPVPANPPQIKIKKAEAKKATMPTPSPYKIRIRLLRGETVPSLITLRLYNGTLRQSFLDRCSNEKTHEKMEKSEVTLPDAFWTKHVRFYCLAAGGKRRDISASAKLEKAPAGKLIFTPSSVYHADYAVSGLPPEGRIYAEMTLEGRSIRSNRVSIPPKAGNERVAFCRDAQILYRKGDYAALLKRARTRAQMHPKEIPANWFLGLALEGKGECAGALKAYRTVLNNLPRTKKKGFQEFPLLLFRHIEAVKNLPNNHKK